MVKCGVKEEERLRKRNRMCQDFHMETKVKNIFFIYLSFLFLDALMLLIHEERVSSSRRQVELQRESG